MPYITSNQLSNTIDLPVALASTELRMGDWIVLSVVKIATPMRLTYRMANIQLSASTVDPANITAGNKIYGNLGLCYLALRKNYTSGSPGVAGGLDALVANYLGDVNRDLTTSVIIADPGSYSWIIANNMQPSTDTSPVIPLATSIDFRVSVTGSVRLEMSAL